MLVVLVLILFAIGATFYSVPVIHDLSYEDGVPIGDIILIWLGWIPLLCVEIGMNVFDYVQGKD